jgi:hypothetical protein
MEHAASGESGRPPALCLTIHAGYGCRHSGACCTAGWPIPIEAGALATLRLHFHGRPDKFDDASPRPAGAGALAAVDEAGACAFFEADRGRLCAIHRELGPDALPDACRQFPRVVLQDPRGTMISLSHFCPTAAGLLLEAMPLSVVGAGPALALDGRAEGLDARGVLPPLLRPGMLTDVDGYARWETRALEFLDNDDLDAAAALAAVDAATVRIQDWRPGGPTLAETVAREFAVASPRRSPQDRDANGGARSRRVAVALASIPAGTEIPAQLRHLADAPAAMPAWWADYDRPIRMYLASRLFGNWVAYQGAGLHAIVEYLSVALALVTADAARPRPGAQTTPWQIVIEAVRNADLVLMHLADQRLLARRLG